MAILASTVNNSPLSGVDIDLQGGMMETMLPFLIACSSFGILFVIVEATSRRYSWLSGDASRKFVHIVAGLMAAFLPNVLTFPEITALGLFFIGFMAVSKKTHLFPSIHGVKRMTLGEVYYPLSIALTAWLFPVPTTYTYAILVLAISDGFAAVVGTQTGKHPFTLVKSKKSFEGSATFLLTCFVITVVTTVGSMPLATTFVVSLAIALLLAFVEATLGGGLDNLVLPLAAALIMSHATILR